MNSVFSEYRGLYISTVYKCVKACKVYLNKTCEIIQKFILIFFLKEAEINKRRREVELCVLRRVINKITSISNRKQSKKTIFLLSDGSYSEQYVTHPSFRSSIDHPTTITQHFHHGKLVMWSLLQSVSMPLAWHRRFVK